MILKLIETFWTVFHRLYLSALRDTHVQLHRAQRGAAPWAPKVGDIVLVQEKSAPRAKWPIGLIEKLDRQQAQATVRTVNVDTTSRLLCPLKKTFPTSTTVRPINRFYPFETSFQEAISSGPPALEHSTGAPVPGTSSHGSSVSLPPATQTPL